MEGSSGAPVLDSSGRVVGQLTGACGFNLNDVCDSVNNATVDGALHAYYADVEAYLDPQGPVCPDDDGDGYTDIDCGGDDCDDSDSTIHPNASEVCDDGVDNDCDTLIDAADPECGGCSLLAEGERCTADAECCSGTCAGHIWYPACAP